MERQLVACLQSYEALGVWILGVSLLTFVASVVALPILVIRMPADYFLRRDRNPARARDRHPVLRVGIRVAKNVVGAALVVAGIVMLFVPGQGILTILLGLSLVDLPGKRALELRLIRSRPVHGAIDAIRARAGRPPLELPAH